MVVAWERIHDDGLGRYKGEGRGNDTGVEEVVEVVGGRRWEGGGWGWQPSCSHALMQKVWLDSVKTGWPLLMKR